MTLQTSGPISILDIKNELNPVNRNRSLDLDDYYVRELCGLPITPQGQQVQISLFDAYGKTKRVLEVPDYTYTIYFLVVAGGGGGGAGRRDRSGRAGGGGGGGGFSAGELLVEKSSWTNGYILVGNGGIAQGFMAADGTDGVASQLHMATRGVLNFITSQGGEGGRGGENGTGGRGGAGFDNLGGVAGNGSSPGFSAGGGGLGLDDYWSGAHNKGGDGVRWGIDGVTYSGGGGGGGDGGPGAPNGGAGGGGSGRSNTNGESGANYQGGGGGGGASWGNDAWNFGGRGGSGLVKIMYNKAYTQLFTIPGASFDVGDFWMTHVAAVDNLANTQENKLIYFTGPRIPPFAPQTLEYIIP